MAFDFQAWLKLPTDPRLAQDYSDTRWADFGRRVHEHLMSERYITAVNTACISAGTSAQPVHHIARCVRAYLFSGAIAR